MRVFSVVLIFATVALFGVTARRVCNYEGCSLECPRNDNDTYACTHFGNFSITSTKCESNKMIHCALQEEGKVATFTEGPCPVKRFPDCEATCGEGKEICAISDRNVLTKFSSFCEFANRANCFEDLSNDPLAPTYHPFSTYSLLGYGNCGPDAVEPF